MNMQKESVIKLHDDLEYLNEKDGRPHPYVDDATFLKWFNTITSPKLVAEIVVEHWSWIGDNYYSDFNNAFYDKMIEIFEVEEIN